MGIAEKLNEIKASLPETVTLVAVSKTHPVAAIQEAYEAGQRIFGENKVQEMCDKAPHLPSDIQWHLIGHLQTNKVKYIASFVSLIHAVDSLKLLKEINKQAEKNNRVISCLLQFHIAEEDTKFGLSLEEAEAFLQEPACTELKGIRIIGVMGMATFTEDTTQIRREFSTLRGIFETLQARFFSTDKNFREVSMGMSGDYQVAVEEGSTMVRVGSSIFGERTYTQQ